MKCSVLCWLSSAQRMSTTRSRSRTPRPTETPRRCSPKAAEPRAMSWSTRAGFIRRLERFEIRRRRHNRQGIDRVLDSVEEDDDEMEPGSGNELDVMSAVAGARSAAELHHWEAV